MSAVAILSSGEAIEFTLYSNPLTEAKVREVVKVTLSEHELFLGAELLGRTIPRRIPVFTFWGDNAREILDNWDNKAGYPAFPILSEDQGFAVRSLS